MLHHLVPQDKIIPYSQLQASKAEQREPRPSTTGQRGEVLGKRDTLAEAERLKCAESYPAKVGTYQGKVRSMAMQVH